MATNNTPPPPPTRHDPFQRINLERERAYEERHKEKRRVKARLRQRKRRAALKLAEQAVQDRARERNNEYQARYRQKNRWKCLMSQARRRNTDSSARRAGRLRYPEDFDETELQIHEAQNDDITERRLKYYRESWVGLNGGDNEDGDENMEHVGCDDADYFGGDEMASGSDDNLDE